MTDNLDTHAPAYEDSFKYHHENHRMLQAYANLLVSSLERRGAKRVLGLGVGHEVVVKRLAEYACSHDAVYTVLEGSRAIMDRLLAQGGDVCSPHVRVVHTYFEDYVADAPFDAMEMGFVLEHVADAEVIVRRFSQALAREGVMHVAVPNARALHRRLGQAAGFLPDLFQLSSHDHDLGHRRYFDLASLRALMVDCGLQSSSEKGLYLKPFTTDQLAQLGLSSAVMEALTTVGLDLPDLCNGIYMECKLASA